MKIIDNRLLDAKSEQQLIENFNRTLDIIDTLADVVSNISDSQLFKVTFDTDGHGSVSPQYIVEGEKAEEPNDPTPSTGYEFDGWYDGTTKFDFNTEINKHYDLKAKYVPIEYTITYDLKGGTHSRPNPTSYTIETPTFAIAEPFPPSEDLMFTGWTGYNDDPVIIEQGSTGDLSFVANYAPAVQSYTITYNLEGGEFPQGTVVPYAYTDADLPMNLPIPTKIYGGEEYEFEAWADSSLTDYYPTKLPVGTTGDLDLYAQWGMPVPPLETDF